MIGCSADVAKQGEAASVVYCPAPIHPSQETRKWLHVAGDAVPPSAATTHYLNQIGNQQAFFDKGCK